MKMTKKKRRLAALKGWRSRHRTGAVSRKRRRNVSKRKTLKRVGAALKKWVRGNPGWKRFKTSHGIVRLKKEKRGGYGIPAGNFWRVRFSDGAEVTYASREKALQDIARISKRQNPSRVKGRKVKGGRAVTLRNMKTITITRHRNGAVSVRGVQLKGRKR
jgi:hypothetical protein